MTIAPTGNGMPVKVSYFEKWGTATERPAFSKPIPEGTTAQSVIEGYLDAIGGRAQLEKIQTKHSVYEASMQGMTLQMEEKKGGEHQNDHGNKNDWERHATDCNQSGQCIHRNAGSKNGS